MADAQYYYSGQSGRFYWGENSTLASGSCRDWSFTAAMATLDATTLGDTYKVPVSGIRTITGSATFFWARDGSRGEDQTAHDAVDWLITTGSGGDDPGHASEAGGSNGRVTLKLRVEGAGGATGNNPGRGIDMNVKITNLAMTMAHGEIFAANVTFESVGAPTFCNL